jgi:hypothetical protein
MQVRFYTVYKVRIAWYLSVSLYPVPGVCV